MLTPSRVTESPPYESSTPSEESQPKVTASGERVVRRRRRSHLKSRNGCTSCKFYKVKCDEAKPNCGRCVLHSYRCRYEGEKLLSQANSDGGNTPRSTSPVPPQVLSSMARNITATNLEVLLHPEAASATMTNLTPEGITPYLDTLQHFDSFTFATVGSPTTQATCKEVMIGLAMAHPYLMHGMLAVSASHLKHLSPGHPAHALAESYHWERSLKLLREELQYKLGTHNMDPVLSTSMLLVIASFYLEAGSKPQDSWIFKDDPGASLAWFSTKLGFHALMTSLGSHLLSKSIWMPVFVKSHEEISLSSESLSGENEGLKRDTQDLVELCEIVDLQADPDADENSNPYLRIVQFLLKLRELSPTIANFDHILAFLGIPSPELQELIRKKDPKALVILSHWFAIMYQVPLWWVTNRVRNEFVATCMYLDSNCTDPRVARLMFFPKHIFGYVSEAGLKD